MNISLVETSLVLERETGLEPATFSLARRRSTTELLPPTPTKEGYGGPTRTKTGCR